MKKLAIAFTALVTLTGSAFAADLAPRYTKAPPVEYAPVFSWTGFYIGANAGLGGDKVDYPFSVFGTPGDINLTSFGGFGGGQIGYNYQFAGNWVFGVEADIQGADIKSRLNASIGGLSLSTGTEIDYFGTVRGRLGYAFNNLLIYGTGGYAYGHEKTTLNVPGLVNFSQGNDLSGWTAGAGAEWAMNANWSFKTEYLYTEYDRNNVFTTAANIGGTPLFAIDDQVKTHTLKFGVNYRFGWAGGPVVAKY